ncbi:MAG TPA: DUF2207 domain-containing protein [Bacillota bacterium]|nr:DUF2207 domain-containing protein [Clostridiaceae bacterium]HNR04694.1 DUF2207 domain-containing protein [Bacillota bacterium]HNT03120.1 DUF2207 domain-containing protein [Bacillota bacterium]HPX68178.1 DUF2207 domain-containing protein [Bacillota bacterium]HQA65028.1 DUF2207 domain-containing protein [Bacillota bacterium]
MRRRITILLIFLITCALLSVITAYCDDRSYYMSSFKINAQLDSMGNMDIIEEITYEFDGSFRGVYRTLRTAGSDGIEAVEVYKKQPDMLSPFVQDNSERDNTFQLIGEDGGIKLKIFSAAVNESRTFILKYRVLNAAAKFNDIAEIYWKFMGEDTEVKIENFELVIKIPEGADKEQIKVFGHGPLSGFSEIADSKTVVLRVDELPARNFVEARVLFPPELIKDSKKVFNRDALAEIMSEEKEFADEANEIRTKARIIVGFSFVYVLFELLMIVYLYFKFDKEYKAKFAGDYFRELPGSYSPAVMAVLWNFGSVKPRDLTATLMDLVRMKYLELIVEKEEVNGLFGSRADNEYIFKLNKEADLMVLSPHEKYAIEWLIFRIGDGERVSLEDIENSSKTRESAIDFSRDYDIWTGLVKSEADSYSFFDKNTVKGILFGVLTAVIGMIFGGYTAARHDNILGFAILMLVSIILLIYSLTIRRRSKSGVEQFKMWKAFRKFLRHFSSLDKADLPAVIMWEHYLVYAISLGVAKEVISQLRLVFREEDFNNSHLTYLYYGRYGHIHNYFDTIDNITDSMVKTTESVYRQAMSKASSGSGGGGGFSGGGGGGGGGGAGAF